MKTCVVCGTRFTRRSRQSKARWESAVCCSPKCQAAHAGRRSASVRHAKVRRIPCPHCGKPFWPWANGVSHARKACCLKPKATKAARVPRSRDCTWCGQSFVVATGSPKVCSKDCARRVSSQRKHIRRRAHGLRTKQVTLSLPALCHRYNWTCQLCGQPVPRGISAPDPLSPSIDHIIPLSKGGTHTVENVQLAHYRCNTKKGNRA